MWETFEVGQVISWVDRNLRTDDQRDGRQIFGLSQGGFCSFSIASRHPDMFLGASSYSGVIDTSKDEEARALITPIVQFTTTALDNNPDPDTMFGPRATQELNWAAHDPATLVPNMRGMDLTAYTGNGERGPLDPAPNPGASTIENGVHTLTTLWKKNADEVGVDTTTTARARTRGPTGRATSSSRSTASTRRSPRRAPRPRARTTSPVTTTGSSGATT